MSHSTNHTFFLFRLTVFAAGLGLTACGQEQVPIPPDHRNAEYAIEGRRIRLVNGVADEEASPGSAARIAIRYVGNDLRKDLNGDGRADVVFVLTQETGGSGTFYYVVAALATDMGYEGSQALLLGDRVAPQTIESGERNIVIVNYHDRAPGEPFSTAPSVAKSLWLLLDPATMQFGEVAQNFEGEAEPARMTLDMTAWRWVRTTYSDGRETIPRQAGEFTVTFSADGTFTATTDCNDLQGAYTTRGDTLSFGPIATTRMFCAQSQENEFSSALAAARSYRFTSRGELVLALDGDQGSIVLR